MSMKTSRLHRMVLVAAMVLTAGGVLLVPNRCAAETISEWESNNSLTTAQNVDGHFTLDYSFDIGDGSTSPSLNTSLTIPHVTIVGSGDGTFDYYSFYAPGWPSTSGRVILDIDWTTPGFDSVLGLWAADGMGFGLNDDYDYRGGAGGSTSDTDSLWGGYLDTPGTYIVGVARYGGAAGEGGFTGAAPETGDFYVLQISVEGQTIPEPSTLALLGMGAFGLFAGTWRRRKA